MQLLKKMKKSERGQVVVFFVLVIPVLMLLLVTTVRFSKLVFEKIRLQETTDRAVYAGAGYLTEVLNQTALLNWKVYQLFLDCKKDFIKNGSKRTEKEAREKIQKTLQDQNALLSEMEELGQTAFSKAYQIANRIFHEEFPQSDLILVSQPPIVLKEGPQETFYFDRINGVMVDPTGHARISKVGLPLRMAFVKDPSTIVGFSASAEIKKQGHALKALSAAEPYAGSLWRFAISPDKSDALFYRTAKVPVETFYDQK
ncbi:MAG: hypothetical protein A3H42_02950 [Deltaproteobacteria bacterium RIFCSPLOWO2_02_FULL_46_8]|nr:MAG: hypothetical protein A3H42_02950 [Deltaproteobacteria bacterium RIFCSPLOWO2_02_FULL_46_8]